MAVTAEELAAVKRYMRVDHDDDDPTITALYEAAVELIPKPAPGAGADKIYNLAVWGLTLHWRENMGETVTGTIITEIPRGLSSLIAHLKCLPHA